MNAVSIAAVEGLKLKAQYCLGRQDSMTVFPLMCSAYSVHLLSGGNRV